MVVRQTQTTSDICCGERRPVAESENAIDRIATTDFLQDRVGGRLRRFKMDGNGAIAPGIVKLMAAIGNEDQVNAELPRGVIETAGLLPEFAGKEQNSIAHEAHTKASAAAVGAGVGLLTVPIETN
jgi:hypothetical protein